ncbi:MAG TPA: lipocalin-like domain-containing protein [Pseudolabrys sp.]|nr:lipocalin-like domain-containing protein [Pseudolabrys sp.]
MTVLATPVVASLLSLATMDLFAGSAQAQSLKQQAVGTWTLVSVKVGDGEPYGPTPHGLMFLDVGGRFSVAIVRAGIPKFASNNRTTGTDAENAAAVHGSLNYFGTYSVDETDKSITVKIEASNYPNFEGVSQKRSLAVNGDEMTVTNAAPSGGGGVATQIWKRAR